MRATVDCNKLAAAEVHEDSDRLKAEVDCCSLPAAEVEATTDWRQQQIGSSGLQQIGSGGGEQHVTDNRSA